MTHTHTQQKSRRLKSFLKELTPPLLLKVLQRSSHSSRSYKSYTEALAHCQKGAYEAEEVVQVVVEKNVLFRERIKHNPVFDLGSLRTLIGVALAGAKDTLKVIDFGGGGGYHYTIARAALDPSVALHWNVVETPAMVAEAKHLETDELKFFDDIDTASKNLKEVDIVFTSGALQYCPDPSSFLNDLIAINARCLFITRTSFNEGSDTLVNVQKSFLSSNGPGSLPSKFIDKAVFYPNVFVPLTEVEDTIQRRYDIRFKIVEDKAAYTVGGKRIDMYGFFCTRKD
ncbi:MAG: methyltransferase, TIGR04325 family [Verrucomicrobia bacterium]|nr:methyltransferase, TIGR04325 family [Verrucomicrobiota bacterium]